MNLTSLSLLATSAKIRYTMTSNCDRKMSLRNKHLSNGSNLPGTLLQFTTHLSLVTCRPVKHTSVTIVILTNIFTCHDRTFRFMKQGPDPSFSVVLPGVYACVVVCDLETSTIRRARTELSCCATHTHTHTHTYIYIYVYNLSHSRHEFWNTKRVTLFQVTFESSPLPFYVYFII